MPHEFPATWHVLLIEQKTVEEGELVENVDRPVSPASPVNTRINCYIQVMRKTMYIEPNTPGLIPKALLYARYNSRKVDALS